MTDNVVQVVVIDLAELAIELEGDEFYKEPVVYYFGSGKREFIDTGKDSTLYNP